MERMTDEKVISGELKKLLSKMHFDFFEKPTKGHNSKSYRPLAPIPVHTIHLVIVHVLYELSAS